MYIEDKDQIEFKKMKIAEVKKIQSPGRPIVYHQMETFGLLLSMIYIYGEILYNCRRRNRSCDPNEGHSAIKIGSCTSTALELLALGAAAQPGARLVALANGTVCANAHVNALLHVHVRGADTELAELGGVVRVLLLVLGEVEGSVVGGAALDRESLSVLTAVDRVGC